jgi:hypothetical protein
MDKAVPGRGRQMLAPPYGHAKYVPVLQPPGRIEVWRYTVQLMTLVLFNSVFGL